MSPSGCLTPSPSMPIAATNTSSPVIWMPSICTTRRSSFDRSEAIHSFMRAAESATKWREAADFDTPLPASAGTSPSGNRTARWNLRVDTLISIRFIAHWPSKSSARPRPCRPTLTGGVLTARPATRPVLIAPPSPRPQMGTNVLIAWNCSTEQARVTAFAMPILKRASRVIVLTVEGGAAVPGPTGQQLCRYLQLNGVPAKPLTVGLDGRLTGEAILAHANALGCDLLIKGAYTQSRLRQMIFGGTTRYILSNAVLPVLMAH